MIDIALPKGSLEEQTLLLFKQADLEIRKTDREYNPTVKDPRIKKVKILRPQEIPKYVEEGYFDLGISGKDWSSSLIRMLLKLQICSTARWARESLRS